MKNPFVYGEVVAGKDFANRKEEMESLMRDLKDGQNIFLVSPRRYGKTSLIVNVLKELQKEGLYTAYIDLFKISSFRALLELYTGEISRASESKIDSFTRFVKEFFPNLRPRIIISPEGSPSVEIDYDPKEKRIPSLLGEVYDAPQKIALKGKHNFVVVFDEFQEIANLDGERIEKLMRAHFQHHDRVAYLFAGSRRHIIYDMICNRGRAFYGMGKLMKLDKLPQGEFSRFLQNKFKRTGFSVEEGVMDEILHVTENYPYNAQFLCHELWDNCQGKRRISIEDIYSALNKILEDQSMAYITIWDSLTMNQRRLLIAIASSGGRDIFSKKSIKENNLGAVSSVQTSANLLMKKEIVDKEDGGYFITDVFFKEWIKREMV